MRTNMAAGRLTTAASPKTNPVAVVRGLAMLAMNSRRAAGSDEVSDDERSRLEQNARVASMSIHLGDDTTPAGVCGKVAR